MSRGMTREKAIKVLEMFLYKQCDLARTEFAYDADTVWEAVNIASKALEQEPKSGHWIKTSDYLTTAYGSIDYVKCSCCGEDSLEEGDFCPNCGCRMVESQESEDKE